MAAPQTKEVGSAFLVFVITLGGILVTLFSGENVNNFSDVSEVQYAVAFITGIMAAAKDIQSQRKESTQNA
jgi:hypothetical protein